MNYSCTLLFLWSSNKYNLHQPEYFIVIIIGLIYSMNSYPPRPPWGDLLMALTMEVWCSRSVPGPRGRARTSLIQTIDISRYNLQTISTWPVSWPAWAGLAGARCPGCPGVPASTSPVSTPCPGPGAPQLPAPHHTHVKSPFANSAGSSQNDRRKVNAFLKTFRGSKSD